MKVMAFANPLPPKILLLFLNFIATAFFNYLGVFFQANRLRTVNINSVVLNTKKSTGAIQKCYWYKRGKSLVSILRLFKAKSSLIFGALLNYTKNYRNLVTVHSKFLRTILQVPHGVSNALIQTETGMIMVRGNCGLQWFYSSYN